MDFKDPDNSASQNRKDYITIQTGAENKASSPSLLKGLCHIFMMIGSIITFIRNTVFNIIFILLIIAIFALVGLVNTVSDKGSEVIAELSGKSTHEIEQIEPVLCFDLNGPIYEYPLPDDDYSKLSRSLDEKLNNRRINDILSIEKALKAALNEDGIKEIYLNLTECKTTFPVAERIYNAVREYKEKKPDTKITAFAESYGASAYRIATAADRIVIDPLGGFDFKGFASSNLYLKDLLDRFRVEPLVFKAGEFKSAVEIFTQNRMSDGVKKEYQHIFDSLWKLYKNSLNARDHASSALTAVFDNPERFLSELDRFRGSEAELLKNMGLVDEINSQLNLEYAYSKDYGFENNMLNPNMTDYQDLADTVNTFETKSITKKNKKSGSENVVTDGRSEIAVMYGIGEIKDFSEHPTEFTPDNIASQVEKILEDKNIKGVIFYINSPGGSVTASEKIRNLIQKLKETRDIPVYVSMNSLCASGAYWISTACDKLYATPTTITGSIGVFSLGLGLHDLLNEYGISQDGVETSELARTAIAVRMPESQRRMNTLEVEGIYENFISLVKNSRTALKNTDYRIFAEGKVFLCQDAISLKLIDKSKDLYGVFEDMKAIVKQDDNNEIKLVHLSSDVGNRANIFKSLFIKTAYGVIADEYVKNILNLLDNSSLVRENKPKLMAIGAIKEVTL
ncbi:S49 family peptidase [Succinivibrio sp.]|uniref:S49 family peptidase n=1 Tax=Succinivibrio sp. TaxID=2053619 RepID=UPI0025F0A893|nr:S49 family peptidase [Succinivibrio sp.]MBQ9220928.1 S49 family peptidase [Succinivibrio sp.]